MTCVIVRYADGEHSLSASVVMQLLLVQHSPTAFILVNRKLAAF